uniref:Uncharacterized protein n=1 Tax=Pyrodinium bahamense TaxID=73915 RepID=A0A7S0B832_9DINO
MSKQLVGAGWGHFMNLFVAVLFGKALTTSEANNQCVWYLVGFMSDIVFVTFLCWAVTTAARPWIRKHCGIDIGDYEGASSSDDAGEKQQAERPALSPWLMWCFQTAIWLAIMTLVKAVVSAGVYVAQDILYTGFALAFRAIGLCHHQNAQLVTSVIVVPIIGDAFQFAVQDGFLKKRAPEYAPVDGAQAEGQQRSSSDAASSERELLDVGAS